MMVSLQSDHNVIALGAPDACLSGLLCIAFASLSSRSEGDLDTFPSQESAWYLLGVSGGNARITCEMGCLLLPSGYALAVSGESPVDILFHGNGQLSILCLKGSLPGSILRQSHQLGGSLYPQGAEVLENAIARLRQEQSNSGAVPARFGSGTAYQTMMTLYGTGSHAARQEKQLPQTVEAALKIMQQDFAFLDGIGDLALRLQVSQEYLTRVFREHMGITPGKYLVQIRVEQAKLLLQQGDHSIAFVADACGFTNGNYFARVFRNTVGVTPSVYAREHSVRSPLPHPMLDSIYVL